MKGGCVLPRIYREVSPTGIYHVMQRGVGKQIIFESEDDYKFYLKKLKTYKELLNIEVIAYCLMENHVHLLIRTDDCSKISNLMQRIGTSYAVYYNGRYTHSGHVFQGRFACELINDEKYLMTCIRYIHNNPVKAGISSIESYRWSSYIEYLVDQGISDRDFFLSIIGGKAAFISFSKLSDNCKVMDCDSIALSLEDALSIINNHTGFNCTDGSIVKSLAKKKRDAVICALKEAGFTNREIERLTGISKYIVSRA